MSSASLNPCSTPEAPGSLPDGAVCGAKSSMPELQRACAPL